MTQRYRCSVCGHVHEGDAAPDVCPVCGVGPEFFELQEPQASVPPVPPVPAVEAEAAPAPSSITFHAEEPGAPRWVFVGGGAAAMFALEKARAADPHANITLVHRESQLPYDRMGLTRLLAGEVSREKLALTNEAWFAGRRIRTLRGEARLVERQRRVVILDQGDELPYDRLLLATGAHPFVPALAGVTLEGVHVLRTLPDADAVLQRARRGSRCVLIGGGLLGLEMAGALARRGVTVTVLEEAPWLLPRQLARSAAELLRVHLARVGVEVLTQVKVSEIKGDETVRGLLLADGSEVVAQTVILAVGVRPNVELARASGLTVNRGLVIDDGMRTSDPQVWAAGDVAEHRGIVWGQWSVAAEQGALAGRALAGESVHYAGKPPASVLKVLDVPVFSVGRFEPAADESVIERHDGSRLLRVVVRGEAVVGGNLVGGYATGSHPVENAALTAALRRAVDERRPLRSEPELRAALGVT